MTIVANDRRKEYTGNGATTVFTGPRAFSAAHIAVYSADDATGASTLTTAYTLTGIGGRNTVVTMDIAPAAGTTLLILRTVPYEQGADISNQGAYLPETLESAGLDPLAQQIQQVADVAGRSVSLRETFVGAVDLTLPDPEASQLLGWNADGTALRNNSAIDGSGDPLLREDLADPTGGAALVAFPGGGSVADLALATGGALVGFSQLGGNVVPRTISDKAQDVVSAKDYGSAIDGVSDDTAELALTISKNREFLLPRGDMVVTSVDNPLGTEHYGDGRILKAITGGFQQLNTKADIGQHVFGREYLWHWLNTLRTTGGGDMLLSGDSTTENTHLSSPYKLHELVAARGFGEGFKANVVNGGHSSKHTGDWVSTYLTADLATAPDLYVVRWGINDPFYDRSISDFATSLRAGLAQCRASYTVDQMSILLCVPNTTGDTPNDRDERWYEQVRKVVRQAARDYQCCMIDLYSMFKDPRGGAGFWLDDPFGDGRGIHPMQAMNQQIASAIGDVAFPTGFYPRMADNANITKTVSQAPSTYPFGWSLYSGPLNTVNWPIYNANILTFRSVNGHAIQYVASTISEAVGGAAGNGGLNLPQIAVRSGVTNSTGSIDSWHDWSSTVSTVLTLQNGWVAWAAGNTLRAKKSDNVVTLDGLVKSGTTTALTVIATLPVGYRPRNTPCIFSVAAGPTTSTTPCQIQVTSAGDVQILSGATATYVSLSGISFEAGN